MKTDIRYARPGEIHNYCLCGHCENTVYITPQKGVQALPSTRLAMFYSGWGKSPTFDMVCPACVENLVFNDRFVWVMSDNWLVSARSLL